VSWIEINRQRWCVGKEKAPGFTEDLAEAVKSQFAETQRTASDTRYWVKIAKVNELKTHSRKS